MTGGDVSVHTDVEMELGDGRKIPQTFSLGYKGKDAGKTRWLQFISREIEVHPKTGKPTFIDATVGPPTGNQYKLTTDTKALEHRRGQDRGEPVLRGLRRQQPHAGRHDDVRRAGVLLAARNPQFAAPVEAKKVISRAIFVTYLVRDMSILEKVEISVSGSSSRPSRRGHSTSPSADRSPRSTRRTASGSRPSSRRSTTCRERGQRDRQRRRAPGRRAGRAGARGGTRRVL